MLKHLKQIILYTGIFQEWHRVRKYSFGKSLPSELFSCTCSRIVCSKFAIIVFTNTIKRERHDIVIIEAGLKPRRFSIDFNSVLSTLIS